jgi:hypothetical protein
MSDSLPQLFDWPTARKAMRAGWQVRRVGLTDRWLQRWLGGICWLLFNDGTKRVVKNTDFGADEFMALDWTNLPPECVTTGTTPGNKTPGCPLPFNPDPPLNPPGTTPENPPTDTPRNPNQQPPGGGGGGGGGVTSGPITNPPRHQNPSITWPTISVTAHDQETCHDHNGTGTVSATFLGTVSLSSPANYNGPAAFLASVRVGGNVIWMGTLGPGSSQDFQWADPIQLNPGQSQITFSARAWASGSPDLTGSGTASVTDWCPDNPGCDPHRGCCPGEDGHQCGHYSDGSNCCCCPGYYAPQGPSCECVYVG